MELITKTVCLTKHIGVNGNMFGGEVMSLLDVTAAAYATEICKYPKMVTLKVNETLFKKSIKVGHLIMVYGEVKGIGNTSITIKLEVRSHNVRTEKQEIVCETEMVFVKVDEDLNPIPINSSIKEKYKHLKKPEEIQKTLLQQNDEKWIKALAKSNSNHALAFNRVVGVSKAFHKANVDRKKQIAKYNKFLDKLLSEGRITKKEIAEFLTKK